MCQTKVPEKATFKTRIFGPSIKAAAASGPSAKNAHVRVLAQPLGGLGAMKAFGKLETERSGTTWTMYFGMRRWSRQRTREKTNWLKTEKIETVYDGQSSGKQIDVQSLTLGKAPQPAQQGITVPDGSAPVVNVLRGISLILGNSTSARCHTRHCAPEHVHTTNHVSDGRQTTVPKKQPTKTRSTQVFPTEELKSARWTTKVIMLTSTVQRPGDMPTA